MTVAIGAQRLGIGLAKAIYDKSELGSLDEWYPEDANYDKLGDELFEKVMAEHRPECAQLHSRVRSGIREPLNPDRRPSSDVPFAGGFGAHLCADGGCRSGNQGSDCVYSIKDPCRWAGDVDDSDDLTEAITNRSGCGRQTDFDLLGGNAVSSSSVGLRTFQHRLHVSRCSWSDIVSAQIAGDQTLNMFVIAVEHQGTTRGRVMQGRPAPHPTACLQRLP